MSFIYDMVDTWNAGATTFTAIKMNVTDTASAAGSLLMDLQVGGATKEKTSKAGDKTMAGVFSSLSRGSASSLALGMDTNTNGFYVPASGNIAVVIGTTDAYRMRVADFTIGTALLGWGTNVDAPDLLVGRDGPNIFAQRNGATDQQFRLYKTFTNSSNHQRLFFDFNGSSSAARIATTWGGTGTAFNLELGGGTGQWRFDTDGNMRGFTATGGLGYATGAGGTITQLTDKSTGVTLNKITGQITMNAAALAANTTVSFTLTDSAIAASDLVVLNHVSGGTAGAYTLNAQSAAGSAAINVRNVTAGSLSEAIVIGFAIVKSVTA